MASVTELIVQPVVQVQAFSKSKNGKGGAMLLASCSEISHG